MSWIQSFVDWMAKIEERLARLEGRPVESVVVQESSGSSVAREITLDPASWPEREVEYGMLRDRVPENPVFDVKEIDEQIILLVRRACDRPDSGVDWDVMREKIMQIRRLYTMQIAGVVAKARQQGRLGPNGNGRVAAAAVVPVPEQAPVVPEVAEPEAVVAPTQAPPEPPTPGVVAVTEEKPKTIRRRRAKQDAEKPVVETPDIDPGNTMTWPQREALSGRVDIPPHENEYEMVDADRRFVIEAYKMSTMWPQTSLILGARYRYTRAQIREVIATARANGELPNK